MDKLTKNEIMTLQKQSLKQRNEKILGKSITPMKTFENMDLQRITRLLIALKESEDNKIPIHQIRRMTKLKLPEKMFLPIIRNIGLIGFDSVFCWLLKSASKEVDRIILATRSGNVPIIKKTLFKRLYESLPLYREAVNYLINKDYTPNIENDIHNHLNLSGIHAKGLISLLTGYGPFYQSEDNKTALWFDKNKPRPCNVFDIDISSLIIEIYQITSKLGKTKLIQVPVKQLDFAIRGTPPLWMGNVQKFSSLGDFALDHLISFYSPISRIDFIQSLNKLLENQSNYNLSIIPSLGAQPFDSQFKYDTIAIKEEE